VTLTIVAERPDSVEAQILIGELDDYLTPLYPSESRHGFSVDKLIREGVEFFVMRYNEELVGCGGLKVFAGDYAEVKRMYVRPFYRGKGFAKRMLERLEAVARYHQVPLLRLETGIYQTEAIGLYERVGFSRVGPFGEYRLDPLSLFYEKGLG
jgi:GNAT superfamily N-acetyltransferase